MNKILFLICLFCTGIAYLLYQDNLYQKEQKAIYSSNNQLLIKKIKEVYNDKMETDRKIKELRDEAKKDKSSFDWNYNIANSPVIRKLQAN
jgi:hypothetical protein